MRAFLRISGLAIVVMSASSTSWADDITFDGGGNGTSWGEAANWNPNQVPTDEDRAIIPNFENVVIDDDDYVVDSIEIQGALSSLTIATGFSLTLQNDDIEDHEINGTLFIEDDAFVRFADTEDHTVHGNGMVLGLGDGSLVKIDTQTLLVNQLAATDKGFRGMLTIMKTPNEALVPDVGYFQNEGLVYSEGGVVVLENDVELSDVEGALWCLRCGVDHGGITPVPGVMRFRRTATWLEGDFYEKRSPGHWIFEWPVKTCGTFGRWGCGEIELVPISLNPLIVPTFEYAFYDDFFGCGNPAQAGEGDDCEDPWIVNADVAQTGVCFVP
jgi:hypothetical protein